MAASFGTAAFYLILLSSRNLTVITIAIMGLGFSMAGMSAIIFAIVLMVFCVALNVLSKKENT